MLSTLTALTALSVPATRSLAGGSPSCSAPEIVAYLLEDDPAPGTGASFQAFDRPIISAGGQVLFTADTDGPATEDDVVYLDFLLLAQEGDPAPGSGGGVFDSFELFESMHQVNGSGAAAFLATLRDVPAGTDRAIYRNLEPIARTGDAAPGLADRALSDLGFVGIADSGSVGFLADLDGDTGNDSVIYLDGEILYREGDPVPALPGETWDGNFGEIQWNGRGDLIFSGNTSLPTAGDRVIYRRLLDDEEGAIEEVVAQEGQAVAAHTGPDTLEVFLQTALAESGAWVVRGALADAPADANAVILDASGLVAQEGDPVADLPGVVLGNFSGVAINGRGDLLYLADLEGATPPDVDEGLFVNGCLVLTDGEPVPGLPDGTIFTDLGFEDLSINDAGEAVFAAGFAGGASGDGLFRMTVAAPCGPDLDGSGAVDFGDLAGVMEAWGTCPPPPDTCPQDLDGNGEVGFADLIFLLTNWGPCP